MDGDGMVMGRKTHAGFDIARQCGHRHALARCQNIGLGSLAIDPSQVKLNWQPVRRSDPWKTTPHTVLG